MTQTGNVNRILTVLLGSGVVKLRILTVTTWCAQYQSHVQKVGIVLYIVLDISKFSDVETDVREHVINTRKYYFTRHDH